MTLWRGRAGVKHNVKMTLFSAKIVWTSPLRRPDSLYDVNCLDVRLVCGRFLLGHIEAPIAGRLFSIRCNVPVEMYSRLRFPSYVPIIIFFLNNIK